MRPPQNLPPRHEEATRIAVRQLICCWRLFNCRYLYHALSTILAPANCRGFSISPSTPSHLFTPAREAQPASLPHRPHLLAPRPHALRLQPHPLHCARTAHPTSRDTAGLPPTGPSCRPSRSRTAAALRRRGQTCVMAAGLRQSIEATPGRRRACCHLCFLGGWRRDAEAACL